jgi:hypothetical protein
MGKDFIAVRDVDENVYRKFKARAVSERLKLGVALTKAMKEWLEENRKKSEKRQKGPKLKPFNWGPGTEHTSSEIDRILYG